MMWRTNLIALLCGALFGAGLMLSGMTDPANVIGFLDITGDWNPQLMFVLVAATGTSLAGFRLLNRRNKPWFSGRFYWPEKVTADKQLIAGALIFGTGWGLYGYCPGPAIAALVYGQAHTLWFLLAMLTGMAMSHFLLAGRDSRIAGRQ